MIIAVRNASGLVIFLTISGNTGQIGLSATLDEPTSGGHIEKILPGRSFGIKECPEDATVRFQGTKSTFRVARRREAIDKLDIRGELDGLETYLEFTLHLLN